METRVSTVTEKGHGYSLPPLGADLLLVHAPAFFDFRERRDIYFPFPGTSGDVPITPLYEYFPLGFKTLQRYLGERGYCVKLLNLSSILLRYPKIDIDMLIGAIDAKLIGIDFHWMVHVQGSLATAERIKALHKDVPMMLGGISSTYFAKELIRYPFIDMVMRGYDTHEPMEILLAAIKDGGSPSRVPNLLWKANDGRIHDNGFSFLPATFGYGIDWSKKPQEITTGTFSIRELLSTQSAGCLYNCTWCGGSREAFKRTFRSQHAISRKAQDEIEYEFSTIGKIQNADKYHFYSVGSYNHSGKGLDLSIDLVGEAGFKSASYEQYHLTSDAVLQHMASANKNTKITLSPDSHDLRVAKLAGRGVYTNEELEAWIERALAFGISGIDIWYLIGLQEQDEKSVMGTVEYCRRLLEKFKGGRVNTLICPMIPYLDPASTLFELPEEHGYRVFYRTVEEHRRGMERASIVNRINYETKWLSRSELVNVGFRAVRDLMEIKAETGVLPASCVKNYNARIEDALNFIDVVHEVDNITDPALRGRELENLGDEILRRNNMIFFSGVMNQAFPVNRQIGGRWFDEMGWETHLLEAAQE
jgi:clorobiocin biosynthesis protein CloN6